MQSSANVELSPEEYVTVSVSANDLGDSVEGGVGVSSMAWLPVSDCNEGIPFVPIQEPAPSFF